jgi:hypothetical protein
MNYSFDGLKLSAFRATGENLGNIIINYPTEWWHYSYGDRYWAYHQNQPHAIYGPADEC